MKNNSIKHLIFDLGGVIVNLDVTKTLIEMSGLFGVNQQQLTAQYLQAPFFKQYERGEIGSEAFRSELCRLANKDVEDRHIDKAWNAMIGNTPMFRIDWLKELSKAYKIHMLSNTNHLHIVDFHEKFRKDTGIEQPHDIFDSVFYSYEIGHRKPEMSCYEYVLETIGAKPEEAMFFDDNQENIKAAQALGINSVLVPVNKLSKELLPDVEV
ncbi:MAG TPA: HAD family phosphatase [Cytophagales bacterium]|nr:HAD family phosphatase [Cytophagales bacterium]